MAKNMRNVEVPDNIPEETTANSAVTTQPYTPPETAQFTPKRGRKAVGFSLSFGSDLTPKLNVVEGIVTRIGKQRTGNTEYVQIQPIDSDDDAIQVPIGNCVASMADLKKEVAGAIGEALNKLKNIDIDSLFGA